MKRLIQLTSCLAGFFLCCGALQAQTLRLSIRSLGGTLISGDRVLMNEVDGLGVSRNPMGDVYYDAARRGAYYDFGVEVITEAEGGAISRGVLSVTRSRAFRPTDIPQDALYDADYGIRFGPGAEIHLLNDVQPYIIRSDLGAARTSTSRKIGVFVSERLPPGRYEGSVIYSFSVPQ
ncbi:MAG: hypothetical protein U1F66_09140 [bacterium]